MNENNTIEGVNDLYENRNKIEERKAYKLRLEIRELAMEGLEVNYI